MNKRTSGDQPIPAEPLPGLSPVTSRQRSRRIFSGLLAAVLGSGAGIAMADTHTLSDDLTDMSLEALMDIKVASVNKKPEKRSTAADRA